MAWCRLAAALPRIVFTMKRPIRAFTFAAPPRDLRFKIFSQRVFADRPIPGVPHETADMRLRDPQPDQNLDGAALLVRRLKPRPTAPACHVESPIDDFLLPLSPRRVRVFMHTRTEVAYAPVAGGGLERKKPR